MAQQEVGEVESTRLGFRERGEYRSGREELVAMRPRDALDPLFTQHLVEQAAGAAVGVGDKDGSITAARLVNHGSNGAGNLFRAIVQIRRQAAHVEIIPVVGTAQ